jgi:DnaJ-like protein/uncharacterized protein DUF4388
MNGQLSEHPLAELIREISAKSLGGRLSLEHDRIKVVTYFENGKFVYAAANLRTLRLRDYLKKSGLVSDADLARFDERLPDIELVKQLPTAAQLHPRLVTDVLRMALSWSDGPWKFEARSRLNEELNLKIDIESLLLEAGRRMPPDFVASLFTNENEKISPVPEPLINNSLSPAEAFLLSRLDQPMTLRDLVALSGVGEAETLRLVYSLALAGLLLREEWKSAFLDPRSLRAAVPEKPATPPPPPPPNPEPQQEDKEPDVDAFLERVRTAQTYYDVLGVSGEVTAESLKTLYYKLARRYHPDRFRKTHPALITRIESAFARITQSYDTLRDDRQRAAYDAKLQARKKAEQLKASAPKPTTRAPQPEPVVAGAAEPMVSAAERAEAQFKEGFAALELGQRKVALGLFASAAGAVPKEPRYRAFYGQMLAGHESTRRAAEAEFLAAIKLDPQNAEYRVMLAELYRDLGLKLRAKGEAERALGVDPDNAKARDLLRALT